jgi:formate-dependent nitrite reductase membrane component NrfD
MQACPYDALYIDPKTETAAKCNYCAHRVDIGLEPACVNVCPEHAIISGDMENPETEIAQLLSRQQVSVRKGEKGTKPNLFYIDGDQASLQPTAAQEDVSMWSAQTLGVGHYAKEAEKMAFTNPDVINAIQQSNDENKATTGSTLLDVMKGKPRKAYQPPDKGILWGWEVSGYVWTKAISAGSFLVLFLATLFDSIPVSDTTYWWTLGLALFFLTATGVLLVMDLDQPKRFLNVLLRPQWKSWLVKGGYSITIYGGLITLLGVLKYFEVDALQTPLLWATAAIGVIVAVYTAFLFAQAKGRDFWQSPALVIHMLVHSFMAGAATFGILSLFADDNASWMNFLKMVLIGGILVNFFTIIVEVTITHPTSDAKKTVQMITKGMYKNMFWGGVMIFGNIIPFLLLSFVELTPVTLAIAGAIVLIGIYFTEKIWVEAPQRIPLS